MPIRRRSAVRTAVALVLGASTALVLGATPASAIGADRVLDGLDQPVAFTFDADGRIWYVEKATGEIHIADRDADTDVTFADVPGVDSQGERGLLGIALHPGFASHPFVYVYATRTVNGHLKNQVLRYRDTNDASSDRTVIFSSAASSSAYHNGGHIAFGPDGKLYVIVGDGHDSSNAQQRADVRGKILRLNPDGSIPDRNPFGTRLWAYGIRNSFGFTFDPETGRLWETENGPECNDEINLIRRGGNYGWGPSETCSGASPGNTNQDGPHPIRPRLVYGNTIAVTGIAFCHRCGLGSANDGAAFHAAANDGRITRLLFDRTRTDVRHHSIVYDHGDSTLSVEVGPRHRIYFSDFSGISVLTR
jgi:glucose/arabinose dehydrogenase